jgi:hypothetical protein
MTNRMLAVDISTIKYPLADLTDRCGLLITNPSFPPNKKAQRISKQSVMWPSPPSSHYCHRLDKDIKVGYARCSSLTARTARLVVVKLLIELCWPGIAL